MNKLQRFPLATGVVAMLVALTTGGYAAMGAESFGAAATCEGHPATIVIAAEPDAIEFGTDGDDVVAITAKESFSFDAKAGDDIVCGGPHSNVYGGKGNDILDMSLEEGFAVVHGGAGDDVIRGGPEDELLQGDTGDDTILAGPGDDQSSGGSGDDRVQGGAGRDFLGGGVVRRGCCLPDEGQPAAAPGIDAVRGGPGDDVISDSASSEVLEGGPGKDVLTLSPHLWSECDRRPVATATPVLDVGAHTVTGLGTDTFSGFETYRTGPYTQELIGSSGPDRFVSGCGRNTILGHGGRDTIVADSCNVSIKAGPGADIIKFQATGTVRGGAGADIVRLPLWEDKNCRGHAMAVSGGPGRDWVAFPGQEARFVTVIDLRKGLLQSPSGSLHIQLAQMENVLTSGRGFPGHRQLIIGTAGSNVLIGRDGPTTLRGLGGNDVLDGAGGRDSAYGGKGHDICRAEVRHQCEASR